MFKCVIMKSERPLMSKKYPTLFFPAASIGERVGKLSVVVEGTFMRMRNICCHTSPPDASVAW
jgi:hypothetical protein